MSHGAPARQGIIVLEAGLSDDEVTLRIDPPLAGEIRSLLRQENISHGDILEFSQTVEIAQVIGVTLGPGGALWMLKPVLLAWIQRHQGKSYKIKHDDLELEVTGCSPKQVDELLTQLQEKRAERAEQWRRLTSRKPGGAGDDNAAAE